MKNNLTLPKIITLVISLNIGLVIAAQADAKNKDGCENGEKCMLLYNGAAYGAVQPCAVKYILVPHPGDDKTYVTVQAGQKKPFCVALNVGWGMATADTKNCPFDNLNYDAITASGVLQCHLEESTSAEHKVTGSCSKSTLTQTGC
jgi:hypothetical protein